MHSCVEVRALVELSFGMVSRVGPGIGVSGVGGHAPRGRRRKQLNACAQPSPPKATERKNMELSHVLAACEVGASPYLPIL